MKGPLWKSSRIRVIWCQYTVCDVSQPRGDKLFCTLLYKNVKCWFNMDRTLWFSLITLWRQLSSCHKTFHHQQHVTGCARRTCVVNYHWIIEGTTLLEGLGCRSLLTISPILLFHHPHWYQIVTRKLFIVQEETLDRYFCFQAMVPHINDCCSQLTERIHQLAEAKETFEVSSMTLELR